MSELLSQLVNWIAANPLWAGLAVFFVAFVESVAVFGLLVPGVVAMFAFGALIATGTLEFWPVFGWAVAGAVAGDGLSFWLGRHYQGHLRELWPFSRHPKTLQRGIDFFQRYGGKSVAIGRFFGPVRAIIPLVAGMLGMSPWRFFIANLLSALVWAPAYLLPGIVFGASLELASEVAFRLVLLLLLLLSLSWLLFIMARGLFRLIQPHATQLVQWAFDWGQLHPGFRSISSALADPDHPEAKGLAGLATLLLVTTLLFVLLTGVVLGGSLTAGMDQLVYTALQSLRSPWGDHLMTAFSAPGDLASILLFTIGLGLLLWLRGERRATYYLLAASLFGLLAPWLLKVSLQIPRPPAVSDALGPWSFPSAHVLRAVTLYGFFSIMLARSLQRQWRWLPYSLATLLIGAVSLSRLYLGVHWLTDIFGSLMLGTAWVAFLGIAYHRHVERASRKRLMIGAAVLLSCLAGWPALTWHDTHFRDYQPDRRITRAPSRDWQENLAQQLPRFRDDLRGTRDHPLNLALAGDPQCLLHRLSEHGWQPAQMLDWHNLLRLLSPHSELSRLPVLPQVHGDAHERAVFSKQQPDGTRLLLRLWSTNIRLLPGEVPLLIGNVSRQQHESLMHLLVIPRTEEDFTQPFKQLLDDLGPLGSQALRPDTSRLLIDLTGAGHCTVEE
ncbi:MAG: VTT domain-containing protein [Chromatiales bacterium]|jgi:undecaprenyl-diphosphatase